jgi:hypothetical protein
LTIELAQQTGTLVGQARHQARTHGNAGQPVVRADQRHLGLPGVIELDKGQAGDAQETQRGIGGLGDGCAAVHGDAQLDVASGLAVQLDHLDTPHRDALVAHAGLILQAGNPLTAGDLEQAVLAGIARQPCCQRHQQHGHHQHKGAGGNGV